jgi:hypothetical protein
MIEPGRRHVKSRILSDDVIARITAEEMVRLDIRSELENSKRLGTGSRIWKFVNSAFGIFLLGTIFVTGFGSLISSRSQEKQEQRKLLTEFDYRLNSLETWSREIQTTSDEMLRGVDSIYIWRATTGDVQYQPVLPEYKNLSWISIVEKLKMIGFSRNSDGVEKALRELEAGATIPIASHPGYNTYPAGFLNEHSKQLRNYSGTGWQDLRGRWF